MPINILFHTSDCWFCPVLSQRCPFYNLSAEGSYLAGKELNFLHKCCYILCDTLRCPFFSHYENAPMQYIEIFGVVKNLKFH